MTEETRDYRAVLAELDPAMALIGDPILCGLILWGLRGAPPGGFLTACLENDLVGAVGRADHHNQALLSAIVALMYNHLPAPCWGSKKKVEKWAEARAVDGPIEPFNAVTRALAEAFLEEE